MTLDRLGTSFRKFCDFIHSTVAILEDSNWSTIRETCKSVSTDFSRNAISFARSKLNQTSRNCNIRCITATSITVVLGLIAVAVFIAFPLSTDFRRRRLMDKATPAVSLNLLAIIHYSIGERQTTWINIAFSADGNRLNGEYRSLSHGLVAHDGQLSGTDHPNTVDEVHALISASGTEQETPRYPFNLDPKAYPAYEEDIRGITFEVSFKYRTLVAIIHFSKGETTMDEVKWINVAFTEDGNTLKGDWLHPTKGLVTQHERFKPGYNHPQNVNAVHAAIYASGYQQESLQFPLDLDPARYPGIKGVVSFKNGN